MADPKTILILDDAKETAKEIDEELQEAGFRTIVVTTLDEASTGLKKRRWKFDLVVFDFWFTELTGGYEVFRILIANYSTVPRVLFSKARWAIATFRTPEEYKELALEHFKTIEDAGTPIVDKINEDSSDSPASPGLGDAINDLVKTIKGLLSGSEATT